MPPTILHVGAAVAHIGTNWLSQTIAQAAHRGGIVFTFPIELDRLNILSYVLEAVDGAYRRSVSATEEDQVGIGSVVHVDVLVDNRVRISQAACRALMRIVNNSPLAVKHLIRPHHLDAFLAKAGHPRPVWRCAMLELLGALLPHRLNEAQRLFLLARLGDPGRQVRHVAASLLTRRGLASYTHRQK